MKYIDIESLNIRLDSLKTDYHSKKPFKYVIFENFFPEEIAEDILNSYPTIQDGKWDGTTYLDQKNKFQKLVFKDKETINITTLK